MCSPLPSVSQCSVRNPVKSPGLSECAREVGGARRGDSEGGQVGGEAAVESASDDAAGHVRCGLDSGSCEQVKLVQVRLD